MIDLENKQNKVVFEYFNAYVIRIECTDANPHEAFRVDIEMFATAYQLIKHKLGRYECEYCNEKLKRGRNSSSVLIHPAMIIFVRNQLSGD